jgi:eukaryotic-like serine/threonine-protein kinase
VYSAEGMLRGVRFDPMTLRVLGDPVPVVEPVMTMGSGAAQFAISSQGTLVYIPGGGQVGTNRSLVWLTRQGREQPTNAPSRAYTHPRLSPDETRVALDVFDQEQDIWIWDLRRESLTRFTLDPGLDIYPTWTPDSRRIIFSSTRGGEPNLYWQPADGTGMVETLTTGPHAQNPYSVTVDGGSVVLSERTAKTAADISLLRLDRQGPRHTQALISTSFEEINAELSADGRWLAYQSNESGRNEVYVRPFPNVDGGRWQISTGGGSQSLWARSGAELFFLDSSNNLMSVAVRTNPTFIASSPTKVLDTLGARYFTAGPGRTYDVSGDGQRFLLIRTSAQADQSSGTASASMVVVLNWLEELKQRMSAK